MLVHVIRHLALLTSDKASTQQLRPQSIAIDYQIALLNLVVFGLCSAILLSLQSWIIKSKFYRILISDPANSILKIYFQYPQWRHHLENSEGNNSFIILCQ